MTINNNLRQLRLDKGMTQEQVAQKIGVTRQALSSYESGRTRPDIDMLLRLSDIYETDLDTIIYGQQHQIKSIQKIKITACLLFTLLSILTAISSAFLWSANHFFPIPKGQLSSEELQTLLTPHQQLTTAWETTDAIILTLAFLGFLVLLILLAKMKTSIPLKAKLIYIAALSITLLTIATLFGITDTTFTVTDYVITPVFITIRSIIFLIINLIIETIHKKRNITLTNPRKTN